MTPQDRAEFLNWLSKLDLPQLREVSGHVNAVITHKRGARLRLIYPGAQIVYTDKENKQRVGTVVKLHKVSVVLEDASGIRTTVGADDILGWHRGRGEYAPLETTAPQPVAMPQPATQEYELSGTPEEEVAPDFDQFLQETPPSEASE